MTVCILWMRRDLRLDDNPALCSALRRHTTVIPVYILENDQGPCWQEGRASRWWLHHSLVSLDTDLRRKGSRLLIRNGNALEVLRRLVLEAKADAVYWNRLYTPQEIERDRSIKRWLEERNIEVVSHSATLLKEPWDHKKGDGTPYRVFTPFWKTLFESLAPGVPEDCPESLSPVPESLAGELPATLGLLPKIPWDRGFYPVWRPGEEGAFMRLDDFVERAMSEYHFARDIPSLSSTSRLSPHLRFGEISIRRLLSRIPVLTHEGSGSGSATFIKELGWREFAHHLLFHFPQTDVEPLDARYVLFPWRADFETDLAAWQQGRTGYPIIDAGMRELWATGWMHNRVRMIVASFLTKNLLVPWQKGAEWFWDTLVDADLAANSLGWQWSSGCGADAAPYFRIFNPILQGEKFDPEGHYVRQWIPELGQLPSVWIHRPFECASTELESYGVCLGQNYPQPIVDLRKSRDRALQAYDLLRSSSMA